MAVEAEGFVQHAGGELEVFFIDQHGNFDFGSGNQLNVDVFLGQGAEHGGGHVDVRTHADADDRYFAYGVVAVDIGRTDAFLHALQQIDSVAVVAA